MKTFRTILGKTKIDKIRNKCEVCNCKIRIGKKEKMEPTSRELIIRATRNNGIPLKRSKDIWTSASQKQKTNQAQVVDLQQEKEEKHKSRISLG